MSSLSRGATRGILITRIRDQSRSSFFCYIPGPQVHLAMHGRAISRGLDLAEFILRSINGSHRSRHLPALSPAAWRCWRRSAKPCHASSVASPRDAPVTNCLNCHSIFYCHQNTRANRCRRATGRGVADDEAGGILLDRGPGRRESAGRYGWYGRAAFVGSVMVNPQQAAKGAEKSMVLVG